jgi:poly(3-hydroxyalkanoate) synthetase
MLGRDFENEAESAESTRKFLLQGIKKFVQELAASREYMKEVGSNRLPPLGHQLRPDWLPLDAVEE